MSTHPPMLGYLLSSKSIVNRESWRVRFWFVKWLWFVAAKIDSWSWFVIRDGSEIGSQIVNRDDLLVCEWEVPAGMKDSYGQTSPFSIREDFQGSYAKALQHLPEGLLKRSELPWHGCRMASDGTQIDNSLENLPEFTWEFAGEFIEFTTGEFTIHKIIYWNSIEFIGIQ